jgi:hypothetical protein
MRFSTQPHKAYCGLDLHARSLDVCILTQGGAILRHRNMQTRPEVFLKAIAPSREDLVVAVACLLGVDHILIYEPGGRLLGTTLYPARSS